MISGKQLSALIRKDLLLEIRQKYTLYGILLYVASTIFVIYLTNGQPEEKVWNALFWVVQLFVSVNAIAKSFLQESKGRMLYFYTIAGPTEFILSKLAFNALLMLVMTLMSLLIFTVLLGNPLYNFWQYAAIASLGGIGLSFVFTFLAAIAAKAQQNAALMAILGFPVIVPQLLLLSAVSKIAFGPTVNNGIYAMIGTLVGFDAMVILLSVVLFPFLWKD